VKKEIEKKSRLRENLISFMEDLYQDTVISVAGLLSRTHMIERVSVVNEVRPNSIM